MGGQEEASWERSCCRAGKMVAARMCRILLGDGAGRHRFLGDYDGGRMFPQLPEPFDVLSPQTYGGPDTGRP